MCKGGSRLFCCFCCSVCLVVFLFSSKSLSIPYVKLQETNTATATHVHGIRHTPRGMNDLSGILRKKKGIRRNTQQEETSNNVLHPAYAKVDPAHSAVKKNRVRDASSILRTKVHINREKEGIRRNDSNVVHPAHAKVHPAHSAKKKAGDASSIRHAKKGSNDTKNVIPKQY